MLLFMVVKIIDNFGLDVIFVISVFGGFINKLRVLRKFVDLLGIFGYVLIVVWLYIFRMIFFLFERFEKNFLDCVNIIIEYFFIICYFFEL